jgi:hypothetical protein
MGLGVLVGRLQQLVVTESILLRQMAILRFQHEILNSHSFALLLLPIWRPQFCGSIWASIRHHHRRVMNPTPTEEDLLACISYLCDEGFITIYQDENDEWFVKIAENV